LDGGEVWHIWGVAILRRLGEGKKGKRRKVRKERGRAGNGIRFKGKANGAKGESRGGGAGA